VLTPPQDLSEQALGAALTREWGVVPASVVYRPVGFGSHHWVVTDHAGTGWFATVDDLGAAGADARYDRLRGALDAARGLREHGAAFVLAPITTAGDEPVARLTPRYALSLYPLVEGESFDFGGYADPAHRQAALDMVLAVHAAPAEIRDRAPRDSGEVPHRDALETLLAGKAPAGSGPYAARVAELFAGHADPVRRRLARHDELAAGVDPERAVLTHGETHPANTLRTPAGWRLIDWETARVAPPERDLWLLGDEAFGPYAAATGVTPRPELLEMYRIRWHLTDLAIEADRFRRPHTGTAEDDKAFQIVCGVLGSLTG
jgi:spectinomycin phosphotransferase/16S rRNA (guanine(1405)-N(7))-methyltransferase